MPSTDRRDAPTILRAVALIIILAMAFVSPARSMPNFARKYSMDCAGCHTTIPRLNADGFAFRKAGFRLPSEIGQEQKTTMEDALTARIQVRYDVSQSKVPPATGPTVKTTNSQLTLHEVTLYPLSASFRTRYASLMELSILNEDYVEIENAYFRYVRGREGSFWSARAGIFHPFEGYGASDRPFSISRPLFQRAAANQNGSTFFTPWNFDEAGIEWAYLFDRTCISATIFNGIFYDPTEAKAFPAGGGALQKTTGSRKNSKDVQLFLNQVLKDDGSGLSGYFYRGSIDLPKPSPASGEFGNDFIRVAGYGSWVIVPQLVGQAGFEWGQDHTWNPARGNADDTFDSQGWFVEADAPVHEHVTLGARFDQFDPSKDVDKNDRSAVTAFANLPANDGLQGMIEYSHLQAKRGALKDRKDDAIQLRLIWIW